MQRLEKNCIHLDEKRQNLIKEYIPTSDQLQRLSSFFAVFSDKTRVKIISALAIAPMCVNDLAVMLSINHTTLSHQLAYLRANEIVEDEREGKVVFYKLKNRRVLLVLENSVSAIFD